MADKAADGIRTNIQPVNVKVIVKQQAFGQVITNKAVHSKDQYTGTPL